MSPDPWDDDFDPIDDEDGVYLPENGEPVDIPFLCAACGEENIVTFDPEGGPRQIYTEDCAVCCRPNLLTLTVDPNSRLVTVSNELEYD